MERRGCPPRPRPWGLVERKTGLPLPLGGNVVLRKHGKDLCADITMDVKNSIVHAIENPDSALSFAKKWGEGSRTRRTRSSLGCTSTREPLTTVLMGEKLS